jgi:integrase
MIPAAVHYGLTAVSGLQAGRSSAAESDPVKPVPVELVEAVIPLVSPQITAMIRLQLLTGMRPGEVTIMRGMDIDTSARPWAYRPARHKNQHRGHERVIYLGPRAEQIIRPFLKTDVTAYLFSPAESEAWRRSALHESRKTPLSSGNRPGSNRRRKPKRTPGNVYGTNAYLIAVYRGCDAAVPATPKIAANADDLKAWRRKHRWHVNQLRHTAATLLRKEHGLEVAQVILGHRRIETSQLYAQKNIEAAKRVMAAVG